MGRREKYDLWLQSQDLVELFGGQIPYKLAKSYFIFFLCHVAKYIILLSLVSTLEVKGMDRLIKLNKNYIF